MMSFIAKLLTPATRSGRNSTKTVRSVLLVTDNLGASGGGVARVVVDTANLLRRNGYDVGVAASGRDGFWNMVDDGVRLHRLSDRVGHSFVLTATIRLLGIQRRESYDIIHSHNRGVALAGLVVSSLTGGSAVEHVHNVRFGRKVPSCLTFRSRIVIACGDAVATAVARLSPSVAPRLAVLPNSVPDIGAASVTLRQSTALEPARGQRVLRLIGVGRLTTQKDPLRFLRVFREVQHKLRHWDVSATWLGSGELESAVEKYASVNKLVGFRLVTTDADARESLGGADLLLLTSRWEGLPLVQLEAMALAIPVVAPNVGACAEAILDGSTGILYDHALTDEQIAQRIVDVGRLGSLPDMGREARQLYLRKFAPERFLSGLQQLYEEAASGR